MLNNYLAISRVLSAVSFSAACSSQGVVGDAGAADGTGGSGGSSEAGLCDCPDATATHVTLSLACYCAARPHCTTLQEDLATCDFGSYQIWQCPDGMTALRAGLSAVVVKLYDRTGKLVGVENCHEAPGLCGAQCEFAGLPIDLQGVCTQIGETCRDAG
jgi:hypothetical protein